MFKSLAQYGTLWAWWIFEAVGFAADRPLTPYQRFEAMRNLHQVYDWPSIFTNKWFVILGWSLIAILLLLLFAVRRHRLLAEKQTASSRFERLAETAQLDIRQREILRSIAERSCPSDWCEIFWNLEKFEEGQSQLMKDLFAEGRQLTYRRAVQETIYQISEKLGFAKLPSSGQSHLSAVPSSRQIPVGMIVLLSLERNSGGQEVSAEVIGNDVYELTVKPLGQCSFQPGELWYVYYNTGSTVWIYEMMVLAWSEGRLSLNHTDRGKLINRRRYARTAVSARGVAAHWPLFGTDDKMVDASGNPADWFDIWVNEIAGPSIRFFADKPLQTNQRILIAFELPSQRCVRDMAYIRQVRQIGSETTYIAELIGLNQRQIDELVGLCNQLTMLPHLPKQDFAAQTILARRSE